MARMKVVVPPWIVLKINFNVATIVACRSYGCVMVISIAPINRMNRIANVYPVAPVIFNAVRAVVYQCLGVVMVKMTAPMGKTNRLHVIPPKRNATPHTLSATIQNAYLADGVVITRMIVVMAVMSSTVKCAIARKVNLDVVRASVLNMITDVMAKSIVKIVVMRLIAI